jgi:hypothetical protein
MSEQHYLKPKQVRKLVEEVARERRGSTLGYTPAEQAAVSTDPESYERGNAFNPVFIYPPENPEPVEPSKQPEFKPETDATQFFQDAATAIDELNAAGERFQAEYLQTNVRLVEKRAEVEYLRNALRKSEQELAEIEEEGSSTDKFKRAIERAQTNGADLTSKLESTFWFPALACYSRNSNLLRLSSGSDSSFSV